MRIATWNVNSLRVRLPQVLKWLVDHEPDVLALQETKLIDEKFPFAEFAAAGYQVLCNGQKTYNGVALLARGELGDPVREIPGLEDPQRRVLAATCSGVRVIDLYVPNGQAVDSDKYEYKLRWLKALAGWLKQEQAAGLPLVVLGDFNIAPEDRDVYDPVAWAGQVLVSEREREALARLQALGLSDVFRNFEQPERSFSWWDYRAGGFRRNQGLRIDLILASRPLATRCRSCQIDLLARGNDQPSDHAPVFADFDI